MNNPAPAEPRHRLAGSFRDRVKRLRRLWRPVAFTLRWPEPVPDISQTRWRWLLVTLGVDGLIAAALAVGELHISTTLFAILGTGILFAVSAANFWGLHSLWQVSATRWSEQTWGREAFIAQILTAVLALYIIVVGVITDPLNMTETFQSHDWRAIAVFALAGLAGLVALGWMLVLGGYTQIRWTTTTVLITALVPLSGFSQYWLQNDYLPASSAPQVDVSVDLSPQTKSGQVTHLSAKVTMHNRGTAQVNVAGALMRVTAYPKTTHQPEVPHSCLSFSADQQWCQVEGGVDLSGSNSDADYRANPSRAAEAQLLYAGLLMTGTSTFMVPGETDTFQRVVDIDSNVRFARLSVSAVFLPERRIDDVKSCFNTHASQYEDYAKFSREVNIAMRQSLDHTQVPIVDEQLVQRYLCMNYEIAPSDVIGWLLGKRYVVGLHIKVSDPQDPGNEYPAIDYFYALADKKGNQLWVDSRAWKKIQRANPAAYQYVVTEYAPGDPIKSEDKH
jgi:hypothetical protein